MLQGFRILLKPHWLALFATVIIFMALCFGILAPWQLGKNQHTQNQNHHIEQALTTPPEPYQKLATGSITENLQWRAVTLSGSYLPNQQALLRLREVDGKPAFIVVCCFRLTTGMTVIVERGYVRPLAHQRQNPIVQAPPPGLINLQGRLQPSEKNLEGKTWVTDNGLPQIYSITPSILSKLWQEPLTDGYVRLDSGQPGALAAREIPQLTDGPYLSYGLQWIAFGVFAPVGLGYFAWNEIKLRRSSQTETAKYSTRKQRQQQLRAQLAGIDDPAAANKSKADISHKLIDRYGH